MRFRGELINPALLLSFLSTIEKVDRSCVLHMKPTQWILVARSAPEGSAVVDGVRAWAGVLVTEVFHEYTIASKSNDEIVVRVLLSNLTRAVKTCQKSQDIVMKLTKKPDSSGVYSPFLTIEFRQEEGRGVAMVQDVPIDLLPVLVMESEFSEPRLPPPTLQLCLPPLRALQGMVDRMRAMTSRIAIAASGNGDMKLFAETGVVTIEVFFKNLAHPPSEGEWILAPDVQTQCVLTLDARHLSTALHAATLDDVSGALNAIVCLCPGVATVIYVSCGGAHITYYLPVFVTE